MRTDVDLHAQGVFVPAARAAAGVCTRFEDGHAQAGIGKASGAEQAGDTGTDDQDVGRRGDGGLRQGPPTLAQDARGGVR